MCDPLEGLSLLVKGVSSCGIRLPEEVGNRHLESTSIFGVLASVATALEKLAKDFHFEPITLTVPIPHQVSKVSSLWRIE